MTDHRHETSGTPSLAAVIITAVLLLALGGAGHRMASARLADLAGTIFLPRGTLNKLAQHIGDWHGQDVPLDARIVEATDTDDLINRTYARSSGSNAVALFIAYGVRMRDLMPHRPEVCYPGSGWTLDQSRRLELRLSDDSLLPCQIHTFSKSGLDSRQVTVLNYYIVDGRSCADVSLLRSKSWKFGSDFRYAAQVQIATRGSPIGDAGQESVRAFAADSARQIRDLLEEAVRQAGPKPDAGASARGPTGGEA